MMRKQGIIHCLGIGLLAMSLTACVYEIDEYENTDDSEAPLKFRNGMWDEAMAVNPILASEAARDLLVQNPLNELTLWSLGTPSAVVGGPGEPLPLPYGVTPPFGAALPANASPYLLWQLEGVRSGKRPGVEVMSYLVRCALAPGRTLALTLPWSGESLIFHGEYGLVDRWYHDGKRPTELDNSQQPWMPLELDEQTLVSQCLATLNNRNKGVLLSVRGKQPINTSSGHLELQATVAPGTHRRIDGTAVQSLLPCDSPAFPTFPEVDRDTCWQTSHVGTCNPSFWVALGTGGQYRDLNGNCSAQTLGSAAGDTMLRVVRGDHGADRDELDEADQPLVIAENDDECGSLYASVTFQCPAEGVFSVMTASYDSRVPLVIDVAAQDLGPTSGFWSPGSLMFPVTEQDYFTQEEMTAFGNVFAGTPGVRVEVVASGGSAGPEPSVQLVAAPDPTHVYPELSCCVGPEASQHRDRVCSFDITLGLEFCICNFDRDQDGSIDVCASPVEPICFRPPVNIPQIPYDTCVEPSSPLATHEFPFTVFLP